MRRTRLTVDHHVDEKYGKLALDSIKQLERDKERGGIIAQELIRGTGIEL